jgi:hypothetical protein
MPTKKIFLFLYFSFRNTHGYPQLYGYYTPSFGRPRSKKKHPGDHPGRRIQCAFKLSYDLPGLPLSSFLLSSLLGAGGGAGVGLG